MNLQRKLTDTQIKQLYVESKLSCQSISRIAGVSRIAIWKALQKLGVNTRKGPNGGTRVKFKCAFCGAKQERVRCQARGKMDMYCNEDCYWADLANPNFIEWRHGKHIARSRVRAHFDLQYDHVVHHKNGDERDNRLANLVVYASQADHMAHHRGRKVTPIWDGSNPK